MSPWLARQAAFSSLRCLFDHAQNCRGSCQLALQMPYFSGQHARRTSGFILVSNFQTSTRVIARVTLRGEESTRYFSLSPLGLLAFFSPTTFCHAQSFEIGQTAA
jgi:hypothetical protein